MYDTFIMYIFKNKYTFNPITHNSLTYIKTGIFYA